MAYSQFGFTSHMTDSAQTSQALCRKSCTSWLLFCGGLVAAPTIDIARALLGHSRWDPDTSFFARHLILPVLVLSFCCCCSAPFFSSLSPAMKFAAAFAAAAIFLIVVLSGLGVSLLLCPSVEP